jgi:hypothetical protein
MYERAFSVAKSELQYTINCVNRHFENRNETLTAPNKNVDRYIDQCVSQEIVLEVLI